MRDCEYIEVFKDYFKDFLGKKVEIEIDCPLGDRCQIGGYISHPESRIFPVNYGHASSLKDENGKECKAYLLGVYEPVKKYEGRIIGVLKRGVFEPVKVHDQFEPVLQKYRENETVLIISPDKRYTLDEIRVLIAFQEDYYNDEWRYCLGIKC